MTTSLHFFAECHNPDCRFRFPVSGHKPAACPACRQPGLTFEEIEPEPIEAIASIPDSPFCGALLDNIRSIYNVGSIFRTADGLSLEHLYLCGISATPEHPRLAKTALGSQHAMGWSHSLNAVEVARDLIARGYQLWALEGGEGSGSLFDIKTLPSAPKIVLCVGNEITGVDPAVRALCSKVLFIPMQGIKGSLNVSVAFGIAAYYLRFSVQSS
jgi:23S rRNA (guanosine2251-2'-O)-methyltransferase